MALQLDIGVPLSALSPKFLHSNSTSHTWPFSAIAELIDNAVDPDVNAKQLWIDKTVVRGQDCLIFMDSGNGLTLETMHKMLSFGYSDKKAVRGMKPIGMYGNGFKSGAMRLGKDAIVFSKSKTASCIGMLSQTYLEKIKADQVVVPMVCFEVDGRKNTSLSVSEGQQASLQHILEHSPFKTQQELLTEINMISSSWSTSKTGTRIIIWNLRKTSTRPTEFDFETERYDIRIPSDVYEEMNDTSQHQGRLPSHIPETAYSLRAYCSILYQKPRMQINIRGERVKSQLIIKSLAFHRKDLYKPAFLNHKAIPIHFGYNTKSKDQYGIMMYHKNRLIKAYERVGCQLQANNKGVRVIGVIECGEFLVPTHNKQSFDETANYRKTMTSLGIKLEEYWQEIRHKRQTEDPNSNVPVEDTIKKPDQNWVQCDDCSRWRKLPDGIDPSKLPDKWYCHMNPDPQFRSCSMEEEAEDSGDDQPAYRKTYKTVRRNLEKRRQTLEEEMRQRETLRLHQQATTRASPSTATTPRGSFLGSPRGGAARAKSSSVSSSYISQAACSSPGSSGFPVISSVCSLSTPPVRESSRISAMRLEENESLSPQTPRKVKRTLPHTLQTTPKRPRVNGVHQPLTNAPTTVDVTPQSSPSVPVNDDDSDETDDDVSILTAASPPQPINTRFNLNKVKQERSHANVGMIMECNDDAALDENNATAAPPTEVSSCTTQTEVPKIKEEGHELSQREAEGTAGQRAENVREKHQSGNMAVDVRSFKTNHSGMEEEAGPSCADAADNKPSPGQLQSMIKIQEQQDQLLKLMESTAEERDSLKDQVHELTCQLQDAQTRLQELTHINVKKESSEQACQTDEEEEGGCYKSLFEKAKQKVEELIKDKEGLLAAFESKPGTSAQSDQRDLDEIALQADSLLRELEERNKERDGLRSQVDHLEEERANLTSQCEELRMSVQQLRNENAQLREKSRHATRDSAAQTTPEAAGGDTFRSDTHRSLIELRHNIGRLLITYVPALDLSQVNYECNVIDEILEQVLCDQESIGGPVGLISR